MDEDCRERREARTNRSEISWSISITSRAAWRLSSAWSVFGGIFDLRIVFWGRSLCFGLGREVGVGFGGELSRFADQQLFTFGSAILRRFQRYSTSTLSIRKFHLESIKFLITFLPDPHRPPSQHADRVSPASPNYTHPHTLQ